MKSLVKYIYIVSLVVLASCSDAEVDSDYNLDGDGGVAIDLEIATKTGVDLDDESLETLMESSILRIYDSEDKLIRRYEPATEMPDEVVMVSGKYTVTLEMGAGASPLTDTENLTYYGECDFTIAADQTTEVELVCNMTNTLVSVAFDDSLDSNLEGGYSATVIVGSDVSDMESATSSKKVTYREDGDEGYFIATDGYIVWSFEGVVKGSNEAISKSGVLAVEAGKGYILTFKYDKYLSLSATTIEVDDSTEDHDDSMSFSPQPTVKLKSSTTGDILISSGVYTYDLSSYFTLSKVMIVDHNGGTLIDDVTPGYDTNGVKFALNEDDDKSGVLSLSEEFFTNYITTAGENSISIRLYDNTSTDFGRLESVVAKSGVMDLYDIDLWNNTATVKFCSVESETPTLTYSESGAAESSSVSGSYTKMSGSTYCYTAEVAPTWTKGTNDYGLEYYTPSNGIWAGKTYEFTLAGFGSYTEATSGVQTITNGEMNDGLSCYSSAASSSSTTWASANNSYTKSLCTYSSGCAYLKPATANTVFWGYKFAAGNLVYGQFDMGTTSGTMYFGQKYTWTSRPKSLNVSYKATVGGTLKNGDGDTQTMSVTYADKTVTYTTDRGRIYLAIVAWSGRHGVTAGTSSSTGMWDPESSYKTDEGNIIGYASYYIDESISSMTDLEIPIYYYDTATNPSNYSISFVISCATSAYGDYMMGSTSSELYLDDFEFGY